MKMILIYFIYILFFILIIINTTALITGTKVLITGNISGFVNATSGSVLYTNGTSILGDAPNFFWDFNNKELGIGTNNPQESIHTTDNLLVEGDTDIGGDTQINGTVGIGVAPSSGSALLIDDDTTTNGIAINGNNQYQIFLDGNINRTNFELIRALPLMDGVTNFNGFNFIPVVGGSTNMSTFNVFQMLPIMTSYTGRINSMRGFVFNGVYTSAGGIGTLIPLEITPQSFLNVDDYSGLRLNSPPSGASGEVYQLDIINGESKFNSDTFIYDNKYIRLGTDKDYTITFDGSNGVFDENETGTEFKGNVDINRDLTVGDNITADNIFANINYSYIENVPPFVTNSTMNQSVAWINIDDIPSELAWENESNTFSETNTFNGVTQFNAEVNINGNLTVEENLTVNDDTFLRDTLEVSNVSHFKDGVTIDTGLGIGEPPFGTTRLRIDGGGTTTVLSIGRDNTETNFNMIAGGTNWNPAVGGGSMSGFRMTSQINNLVNVNDIIMLSLIPIQFGSGNVNNIKALDLWPAFAPSGNVTNLYGAHIRPLYLGTGIVTNAYGLKIDDMLETNYLNEWSLHTGNAPNYFGGQTTVDANLNVTANLNVEGNYSSPGFIQIGPDARGVKNFINNPGDLYIGADSLFDGSVSMFSDQYGANLLLHNFDSAPYFFSVGGTGSINVTTQIFCDSTNPFNSTHEDAFLTVLSSDPEFTDATGEIDIVINSTCVVLNLCSSDGYNVSDAENATYVVFPHPSAAFLDNGCFSYEIGNHPDAKFEIHNKNGTGPYSLIIEDVANSDSHSAISISQNVRNQEGSKAIDITVFTDTQTIDVTATGIRIAADGTNITNSTFVYNDADLLRPSNNSQSIFARLNPFIDFIFKVGSADELSAAWYNDTINLWNVTSNFTDSTQDTTVFEADDSVIYVGNDLNFTTISFTLTTPASQNILPLFYYCNTSNQYELFSVDDNTVGFTQSSSINFINPVNRGKCTVDINGVSFGGGNYTFIAIQRTRNFVVTDPVINTVAISGASTNMVMTTSYIQWVPQDTAPFPCDATTLSMEYYDISEDDKCICRSGGWELISSKGTSCT